MTLLRASGDSGSNALRAVWMALTSWSKLSLMCGTLKSLESRIAWILCVSVEGYLFVLPRLSVLGGRALRRGTPER